jgi:hypothetical protein
VAKVRFRPIADTCHQIAPSEPRLRIQSKKLWTEGVDIFRRKKGRKTGSVHKLSTTETHLTGFSYLQAGIGNLKIRIGE